MSITNRQYIERMAEIAIGASTLRGHPPSTISIAREYLKKIKLEEFQCRTAEDFDKILDKHTTTLSRKIKLLDPKSEYWGSARKAINLFLAGVVYHSFLRKEYRLNQTEKFLEVPLDSQVANKLISIAGENNDLPRWNTIKRLTPEDSKQYQDFAGRYAKKIGCTRIQLDILFWRK